MEAYQRRAGKEPMETTPAMMGRKEFAEGSRKRVGKPQKRRQGGPDVTGMGNFGAVGQPLSVAPSTSTTPTYTPFPKPPVLRSTQEPKSPTLSHTLPPPFLFNMPPPPIPPTPSPMQTPVSGMSSELEFHFHGLQKQLDLLNKQMSDMGNMLITNSRQLIAVQQENLELQKRYINPIEDYTRYVESVKEKMTPLRSEESKEVWNMTENIQPPSGHIPIWRYLNQQLNLICQYASRYNVLANSYQWVKFDTAKLIQSLGLDSMLARHLLSSLILEQRHPILESTMRDQGGYDSFCQSIEFHVRCRNITLKQIATLMIHWMYLLECTDIQSIDSNHYLKERMCYMMIYNFYPQGETLQTLSGERHFGYKPYQAFAELRRRGEQIRCRRCPCKGHMEHPILDPYASQILTWQEVQSRIETAINEGRLSGKLGDHMEEAYVKTVVMWINNQVYGLGTPSSPVHYLDQIDYCSREQYPLSVDELVHYIGYINRDHRDWDVNQIVAGTGKLQLAKWKTCPCPKHIGQRVAAIGQSDSMIQDIVVPSKEYYQALFERKLYFGPRPTQQQQPHSTQREPSNLEKALSPRGQAAFQAANQIIKEAVIQQIKQTKNMDPPKLTPIHPPPVKDGKERVQKQNSSECEQAVEQMDVDQTQTGTGEGMTVTYITIKPEEQTNVQTNVIEAQEALRQIEEKDVHVKKESSKKQENPMKSKPNKNKKHTQQSEDKWS